jgi:membrane-associated protease RseP (regulator of RpoE activity)
MKKLLFTTLVVTSALAAAVAAAQTQTPARAPDANPRGGRNSDIAELQRTDADEAKLRTDLDAARKRLDEAAREVAELSGQLGTRAGRDFFFVDGNGPRRAILGVQIDPQGSKDGARILSVSPGGAAEEAGLLKGDVIVNLDGKKIAGAPDANRAVVDHMGEVKPEQKVKVKVLRDGKNKDFVVVARPMAAFAGNRMFNIRVPRPGDGPAMGAVMAMPDVREFPGFWHGEFGGMELASVTPKLGAYFGVSEGVLVVQAPENAAFKLEDGDVIQSIDGRKPEDGAHAMRILRSYRGGEKLTLSVLRQRKALSLAVTLPERQEFHQDFFMPAPGVPAAPPMPALPPAPAGAPGAGAGTFE